MAEILHLQECTGLVILWGYSLAAHFFPIGAKSGLPTRPTLTPDLHQMRVRFGTAVLCQFSVWCRPAIHPGCVLSVARCRKVQRGPAVIKELTLDRVI